jgi:hypothetical protein
MLILSLLFSCFKGSVEQDRLSRQLFIKVLPQFEFRVPAKIFTSTELRRKAQLYYNQVGQKDFLIHFEYYKAMKTFIDTQGLFRLQDKRRSPDTIILLFLKLLLLNEQHKLNPKTPQERALLFEVLLSIKS